MFASLFFLFSAVAPSNGWGPTDIKYVHVVASNHFDAGYTDSLVNVVNKYFDQYLPQIPIIGEHLSRQNISWKFMEHAWILSLYMECPPNAGLHCPSEAAKKTFIDSVNAQEITWYAFPFNSELSLYGPSMAQFGNYLTMKQLPSLFKTAHIPTVVSQRDVPGVTRSMIPLFKKSNVTAISIGANGRAATLGLPQVFRWWDQQSNEQIVGIYHPGGYGGTDLKSVAIVDNLTHALATYWNGDNSGPPSAANVVKTVKQIQADFPNAIVEIDTFESFVNALLAEPDIYANLPVYSQELGDIWIYGPPSDPLKLAKFRAASRLRADCLLNGKCNLESYPFFNFSRFLLKNGEHTFGGSYTFIGANYSQTIWTNQRLNMALSQEPYKSKFDAFKATWTEQRRFGIEYAMDALAQSADPSDTALHRDIMSELTYLQKAAMPDVADTKQWQKVTDLRQSFDIKINDKAYSVKFDAKTGAITALQNKQSGINYVNATTNSNDGLGIFMYQTYTAANFSDFWYEYSIVPDAGCNLEYCKNGMAQQANFSNTQYNVYASLLDLYQNAQDGNVFLLESDLGTFARMLSEQFGGPTKIYVRYNFSAAFDVRQSDVIGDGFGIEVLIENKTYTRLPETMWFAFKTNLNFDSVSAYKSGEYVDPNDVATNGTFHLQSVSPDGCVKCAFNSQRNNVEIYSLDAAVSAFVPNGWKEFTDIVTPFIHSDLNKGVSFALLNNFWGTNYPQWYPFDPNDKNQTYRFNIYLS